MPGSEKNIVSQRFVHSYLSSVLSISLVLLLMGVAILLAANVRSLSDFIKENIGFTLLLDQDTTPAEGTSLARSLQERSFVREAAFISKEQGIKEMEEMLGKDFLEAFAYNPLPVSIELKLKAPWICADSIARIEPVLLQIPQVREVSYQQALVESLTSNLEKAAMALGLFILLLLLISFVLINNTIRLSVYARRFTIHTMRMVGATKGFIRRPFMGQALLQGIIASLLAILFLIAGLFWVQQVLGNLFVLIKPEYFVITFAAMLASGVIICTGATYFVVNRVVRLEGAALYY